MAERERYAERTKRQRRQEAKAGMLSTLVNTIESWDAVDECLDTSLTPDEFADVMEELSDQLYRWAVRITPPPTHTNEPGPK